MLTSYIYDERFELLASESRGTVTVKSWAHKPDSVVGNSHRPPDVEFFVKIIYHNHRDGEETTTMFTVERKGLSEAFEQVNMLRNGGADVDAAMDVVQESVVKLWEEVYSRGRKSLAMDVHVHVHFEEEEEEEEEEEDMRVVTEEEFAEVVVVVEEVAGEEARTVRVKMAKVLLEANGVRFARAYLGDHQSGDSCAVCLEEAAEVEEEEEVAVLTCSHIFHGDCLVSWILMGNHICPLCRAELGTRFFFA